MGFLCTSLDFKFAQAPTEQQLNQLLVSDDSVEVGLRQIAAHVHVARTGDRAAGAHMLAVRPPGASNDVAPTWLADGARMHSHDEHQSMQRVASTPQLYGRDMAACVSDAATGAKSQLGGIPR